jgi:hypothetical protein
MVHGPFSSWGPAWPSRPREQYNPRLAHTQRRCVAVTVHPWWHDGCRPVGDAQTVGSSGWAPMRKGYPPNNPRGGGAHRGGQSSIRGQRQWRAMAFHHRWRLPTIDDSWALQHHGKKGDEVCTKNRAAMHWGIGSLSEADDGGTRARNPMRRWISGDKVGWDVKGV